MRRSNTIKTDKSQILINEDPKHIYTNIIRKLEEYER